MVIPSFFLMEQLKRSEGFRARPYVCPSGRATIGYGHNLEAHPAAIRLWSENAADLARSGALRGQDLVNRLKGLGMVWTEEYAQEMLREQVLLVVSHLAADCRAYRRFVDGIIAGSPKGSEAGEADLSVAGRAALVRAEVLVDMAFNMGVAGLLGFRRMLAAAEQGDHELAASEMLNSRWAIQVKGRAVQLARQMRTGTR